ncbi:MAG: DUF58 domain-containing protein [Actinomycetota bacterium]
MTLTPRGISVAVAGVLMWLTARFLGSPGLEVIAIGLLALPFIAGANLRWGNRAVSVGRHLSDARVTPGTRVTVRLDVSNPSGGSTSFLLLEDRLPPALGRPARLVVTGVGPRGTQRVSYSIVPQTRGRYGIGPLTVDRTDAFGLTRRRIVLEGREELLVTPEIEDLRVPADAASGSNLGSQRARQLLRSGEEYYTMRGYQEGDDLRRIHWPSVARTGELMIRQDEASRRTGALIYLDSREATLGPARGPAFERAISCAASVGALFARNGFTLQLGADETPIHAVTEELFLDTLSGLSHGRGRTIARALTALRVAGGADTSLVYIAAPPAPQELPQLVRAGGGFGPKLAILVHPVDPATAPVNRRTQLETRATQAHLTLIRAGWDCLVLTPTTRLRERWHTPRAHRRASSA